MSSRWLWFLIGAATASVFWLIVLKGVGQQAFDAIGLPG
jgi:hypothetical protein